MKPEMREQKLSDVTFGDELFPQVEKWVKARPFEEVLRTFEIIFERTDEAWDNPIMEYYAGITRAHIKKVISSIQKIEKETGIHIGKPIHHDDVKGVSYTTLAGRTARLYLNDTPPPLHYVRIFMRSQFPKGIEGNTLTQEIFSRLANYGLNIDINCPIPKSLHNKIVSELTNQLQTLSYTAIETASLNDHVTIVTSTTTYKKDQLKTYIILTDPDASTLGDFRHGPQQSAQQREVIYVGVGQDGDIVSFMPYPAFLAKRMNPIHPASIEYPHYDSILAWTNAVTRMGLSKIFQRAGDVNHYPHDFDEMFNLKTVENLRAELPRLIQEKKFGNDAWHKPEVLTQILVGLYIDYKTAVTLFTKTGLFGTLLFPHGDAKQYLRTKNLIKPLVDEWEKRVR